MTTFIVDIIGIVLIVAIVWWFWLAGLKPATAAGNNTIDILVDGGVYSPAQIRMNAGHTYRLRFLRKDASPCAQIVKFDALNKSAELPVDKPHHIDVQFDEPGRYEFTCQMGMYRGVIVVE